MPAVVDAGSGRVPIFLAHGKLGRTMVSCDDGRTWKANRSERPNARCWDTAAAENIECDHHAWSSVGLVEADGRFLATYGWGYPGMVRSTEDGVNWTDVLPGHTFAGMAYGGRIRAVPHLDAVDLREVRRARERDVGGQHVRQPPAPPASSVTS